MAASLWYTQRRNRIMNLLQNERFHVHLRKFLFLFTHCSKRFRQSKLEIQSPRSMDHIEYSLLSHFAPWDFCLGHFLLRRCPTVPLSGSSASSWAVFIMWQRALSCWGTIILQMSWFHGECAWNAVVLWTVGVIRINARIHGFPQHYLIGVN